MVGQKMEKQSAISMIRTICNLIGLEFIDGSDSRLGGNGVFIEMLSLKILLESCSNIAKSKKMDTTARMTTNNHPQIKTRKLA